MNVSFFYFFYTSILIVSVVVVILSKSPIHSVFYLILTFLLVSILFMILGAEFLSVLLLVVYVGAVAVLFLFVVMMLNLRIIVSYTTFYNYLPMGMVLSFNSVIIFLWSYIYNIAIAGVENLFMMTLWQITFSTLSNVELHGFIIYNMYPFLPNVLGLILLPSMLGAIVLTDAMDIRTLVSNIPKGPGFLTL